MVGREWFDDRTNVAALYRWLVDEGALDTTNPDAVQAFLRAPWEQTEAFRAMRARAHAITTRTTKGRRPCASVL